MEVEVHRRRARRVDIFAPELGADFDIMAADVLGHLGFEIERVRLLIPVGALPEGRGGKVTHGDRRIIDIRKGREIGSIPLVRSPEPLQVLRLQCGGGQAERVDYTVVGAAEIEHRGGIHGIDRIAREGAGVAFRAVDRLRDRAAGVIVRLSKRPELVIAEESLPVIAQIPVRPIGDVPVLKAISVAFLKIVDAGEIESGVICLPYVAHHDLRGRIDPVRRDDIAGEWLACHGSGSVGDRGIGVENCPQPADGVERLGKIAGSLDVGG